MHCLAQQDKTMVYIEGKPFDFDNPKNPSNFDHFVQFHGGKPDMEMMMKFASPQPGDVLPPEPMPAGMTLSSSGFSRHM